MLELVGTYALLRNTELRIRRCRVIPEAKYDGEGGNPV